MTSRRASLLSWLPVIAFSAIIGILSVVVLETTYTKEVDNSVKRIDSDLRVLREHIFRTLSIIEIVADNANRNYRLNRSNNARVKDHLQQQILRLAFLVQISIVDDKGKFIISNLTDGHASIDLADREHIRYHLDQRVEGPLFVGKPVTGRVSSKQSVQVSKYYSEATGEPSTIVVVSWDLSEIEAMLDSIDFSAGQLQRLRRSDGAAIVSRTTGAPFPRLSVSENMVGVEKVRDHDGNAWYFGRLALPYEISLESAVSETLLLNDFYAFRSIVLILSSFSVFLAAATRWITIRYFNMRDTIAVAEAERRARIVTEQFGFAVQASIDGYLAIHLSGEIVRFNPALERITEYTRGELQTLRISDLRYGGYTTAARQRLENIIATGSDRFESQWCAKSGRVIDVEVSAVRESDEIVAAFVRDITAQKSAQTRLAALIGLKNLLIKTNEMIAYRLPQNELFDGICNACVTQSQMRLAWIGLIEPDRKHVRCVAQAGHAEASVKGLLIPLDASDPRGQGMVARAARDGEATIIQNLDQSPHFLPWRELRRKYDLASACAFPLRRRGGVTGHVAFYSHQVAFFDAELVAVLGQVADNLSFALQAADAEQERSQNESRMLLAQARFDQVVNAIDDVFWIADPSLSKMDYVSPAYEKIWGRPCQSVYDQPRSFIEAILLEDRERVLQSFHERRSMSSFTNEYRIARPDGSVRWIWEKRFAVCASERDHKVYVGVARDITERKELERALDQARRLESIGRVTGELAHDFNNLLAIIVLNASQVRKHLDLTEMQQRNLEVILATAARGGEITKSLLAVARRQRLTRQYCDVWGVIEQNMTLIRTAAGAQVDVTYEKPPAEVRTVVDPSALSNALLNLVINARDAMPKGGLLRISVSAEHIIPSDWRLSGLDSDAGKYVILCVSDNGAGMIPDVAAKAFEPFFTTKQEGLGSGLGLAAVYGFARQSGGTAYLDSVVGRGTSVSILLPLVQGGEFIHATSPDVVVSGSGRLLIVDDEPDLLEGLAQVVKALGYKAQTAQSGADALAKLSEQPFDLMLCDFAMRRMNGLELARQVQARWPSTRIILMTGFAAAFDATDVPWLVLEKPLSVSDLSKALAAEVSRAIPAKTDAAEI